MLLLLLRLLRRALAAVVCCQQHAPLYTVVETYVASSACVVAAVVSGVARSSSGPGGCTVFPGCFDTATVPYTLFFALFSVPASGPTAAASAHAGTLAELAPHKTPNGPLRSRIRLFSSRSFVGSPFVCTIASVDSLVQESNARRREQIDRACTRPCVRL